jgi:hypothetical protein
LALPLFSVTLFLSAFTLFLVQPIIGKLILPMLGGTPQVWNTCMVFFQTALLTGYAYSHTSTTRFPLRRQLVVHGALLFVPLLFLFLPMKYIEPAGKALVVQQEKLITDLGKAESSDAMRALADAEDSLVRQTQMIAPEMDLQEPINHMKAAAEALRGGNKEKSTSEEQTALDQLKESFSKYVGPFNFRAWEDTIPLGGNPILWALGLLALLVGLPFIVVATSSPLLQRWFVYTGHPAAKDPYFLSIASNAGSLLALLAYPVVVEPYLTLNEQKWTWTVMYTLLGVLIMVCAATVWKAPPLTESAPEPTPEPGVPEVGTAPPPPPQPQAAKPQTGISRKKFGKGGGGPKQPGSVAAPTPTFAKSTVPDVQLRSRPITPWRRLRWVLLAAAPSSLMLGVVTYICTDLSPIPLLWIIPLALYLVSFICVFAKYPVVWTDMPHKVVLFLQPVLVLGLALLISPQSSFASSPVVHMTLAMLAFFATALMCHGEMAKDRPDTKHLTEFYLWMSVGGMVGGIFNGLVAPLMFWGVAEFPLAIMLGCLLRPTMKVGGGWSEMAIENYFPNLVDWFRSKGNELAKAYKRPEPNSTYAMSFTLDLLLPLLLGVTAFLLMQFSVSFGFPRGFRSVYRALSFSESNAVWLAVRTNEVVVTFLPMVVCFLFYNRPIRLGLAVGALLYVQVAYQQMRENSANSTSKIIYADRSYFGVLRVRQEDEGGEMGPYRSLMHGSTHHGLNYQKKEYRRMATTYYHQYGPAGIVMLKFNWFNDGYRKEKSDDPKKESFYNRNTWKDQMLTYSSDARICTSLIGSAAMGVGFPMDGVAAAWSEPPFATIGLGTGTMASYARPYQHCHYYEIDRQIRRLSLPENPEQEYKQSGPYFNYLDEAIKRGASVEVRMGDARLRMAYPYGQYNNADEVLGLSKAGGPQKFYHMMVVDAFSSDAIPIHLITLEAIKMYMEHLVDDGILCVHTSNRHVDLVPVVQRVVEEIRKEKGSKMPDMSCMRAHDSAPGQDREGGLGFAPGQFTSEWVMVARTKKVIDTLQAPPLYEESCKEALRARLKRNNQGISEDRIAQIVDEYRAAGEFKYWADPRARTDQEYPNLRAWTDDYSNVLGVFRWK